MAGLVKIQEEELEVAFTNDASILFIKSHILKTSRIAESVRLTNLTVSLKVFLLDFWSKFFFVKNRG